MTVDQRDAFGMVITRPGCTQADICRALGWSPKKAHCVVEWLRSWGFIRKADHLEVPGVRIGARALYPAKEFRL